MGLLSTTTLMTPLHVHGVRTPEEYRALQRSAIANGKTARPGLNWKEPWPSDRGRSAFVSGGKWIVICDCGNGPSADPEWRLALCLECGAVYEDVALPDDRAEIERLLLERAQVSNRHWHRAETVSDLARDNAAHGVGRVDRGGAA